MSVLYSDTHPKMEALQIQLLRQATPTRKMEMLAQLNASARTLALMGLRSRYPQAVEAELRRRLAGLLLGEELARAQKQTFSLVDSEVSANFSSAEDTILSKLEWYRMGGEVSDRQWRDVLGVLKTRSGELDLDYLHKWAKELQVSDLFERALKQAAT